MLEELPAYITELEEIKKRADAEETKSVKFAMIAAFEHELCKAGPSILALVRQLKEDRDRAMQGLKDVIEHNASPKTIYIPKDANKCPNCGRIDKDKSTPKCYLC